MNIPVTNHEKFLAPKYRIELLLKRAMRSPMEYPKELEIPYELLLKLENELLLKLENELLSSHRFKRGNSTLVYKGILLKGI